MLFQAPTPHTIEFGLDALVLCPALNPDDSVNICAKSDEYPVIRLLHKLAQFNETSFITRPKVKTVEHKNPKNTETVREVSPTDGGLALAVSDEKDLWKRYVLTWNEKAKE